MSRIKSPNCVDRMNAAERIDDTIKALEAGTFGKAQIESRHTPGPLAVEAENGLFIVRTEADTNGQNHLAAFEKESDATLFSLAPEMFDALRLIANGTHPAIEGGNPFADAQALAQSILSKLT